MAFTLEVILIPTFAFALAGFAINVSTSVLVLGTGAPSTRRAAVTKASLSAFTLFTSKPASSALFPEGQGSQPSQHEVCTA